MNDGEGRDLRETETKQYQFAIREPGGKVRRCDAIEWRIWREANHNMNVLLKAILCGNKCGALVSFEGVSEHPDRPTEFWICTATAHCGPHDGAIWFSKFTSESEAIEKSQTLVDYFAEHGRFPDGPELNLSGSFPKNVSSA
jgi:hypothetical protein